MAVVACRTDNAADDPTPSSTNPPSSPSAPTSATTSTTPLSPDDLAQKREEDAVRDVLESYQREWKAIGPHPDVDNQAYFSLLTGDALSREKDSMLELIAAGRAYRLPENTRYAYSIVGLDVRAPVATVYECIVDDAIVYDIADGTVRNDKLVTDLFRTTLTKTSGRWQISESGVLDKKDGEQPCATP